MPPSRKKKTSQKKQRKLPEKEIKKTLSLPKIKEKQEIFFSKITFWSAIVVIIFANLFVGLLLIPLLLVFSSEVFLFVFLLGVILGLFYDLIIFNLNYLERKHHLLARLGVPFIGLVNIFFVVLTVNKTISYLGKETIKTKLHNPWSIALVFVFAFLLPYLINLIRKKS